MHKNGEWIVVDFACAKSRRVGILHNLTDMRWKPSAFIGLRVDRVPVAYQRPTWHDLLKAISTLSKFIEDLDDPATRKLEALLGPFTRKFRFPETMSMKNTVLTDFLQRL
jgi:hypothetical protein